MKAVVNVWLKTGVILLLLLAGAGGKAVMAQNVPGCDPLGVNPVVDFQLTYDPATNRYTAWYIPTDNTLHRTVTGQFTIIAPNGFTTPGANGRDADFQITNLNGTWTDFVLDNELITSVGAPPIGTLNGLAVHQVGMAPAGIDIDPDGILNPLLTNLNPVTPGVAVPLFSFPGTGCASALRILVNGEAVQSQVLNIFGANLNNEITIQIPRAAFVPALERYCKNAPLSSPTIVLPDIQNDTQTICATSTTYSNNYFTQVLSNWNPSNLPAGTTVVSTANQVWGSFTVTQDPLAPQATVVTDPTSGTYTITFPTLNGVTQPGSVTICNSLRDVCNTSADQACVVISWLSSGTVSITNNPTVCLSNGTAIASLTATSGFNAYAWTGPGLAVTTGNPVTATLTAAGVYSYTVVATSGQSCSATNVSSITVVNSAEVSSVSATSPTSCSGVDGSATLQGLAASQTYTVSYSNNGVIQPVQTLTTNGLGQIIFNGLSAGVYSFTVSGSACTSTPISVTVTDPNPPATPTISVIPSQTICLGSSATLSATGSGNGGVTWMGPNLSQTTGNSVTATPNSAGSFMYTVTQTVGGCVSAPASVTVTVNPTPTVTPTTVSVTACVGGSFNLSATPSGGTPGYAYTWSGPNFSTTTTTNPITVSNALLTQSGSYTVSVTDANQCSAIATTTVSVSISNCCSLTVTPTASQTTVCAGSSVVMSANTLGAIGTPSYQWSPNVSPANTQTVTVTPTSTTTYTVVVTDSGAPNCVRTATITVVVNPTPVVSIQPLATTVCAGNTLQLTANVTTGTVPPYTYTWSGPNFAMTTTVNTVSIPNATTANSGIYTVILTDQNSCTAVGTTPVAITVTPLPTFTLAPTSPASCSGTDGSIAINGLITGQLYSVRYSQNGGGAISSSQMASVGQIILGSLPSGVYSVTVSQNGCSSTPLSVTLTDPVSPVSPSITALPSATICLGGTVTMSATGTNLQWTGMNLLPITGSPVTASPGTSGTFVYTVTQTVAGCTSLPASITVVVNPNPTITNLTAVPACVGQQLTLSATITGGTGQTTVNWLTPDGLTLSGNPLNRPNAQVSMAGNYTVTASDANGCTATQIISTSVGVAPSVQVQPQQSCAGGNVTLTATGGAASYVWTGPNGFSATGQMIVLTGVDASDAGNYTVVVSGGNSCTGTATGVVSVNPSPVVKADFLSTSVCVGTTLNLFGDITTGTVPPYTFSWTGPNGFASTSQNTSILSAQVSNSGSYTFVVTDQNGCSVTATTPASVTVADCCPPRIAQISITAEDPSCGGNTGSATATLLPAAPVGAGVTYQWRNVLTNAIVGTTASVTGLTAGVYSVTITETIGNCVQSFSSTASISETPGPDVSLASVSGANCGAANGSAQLTITGGVTPYTISWTGASSGSTTASASTVQITGLMAGNYIFTVTGQGSTCRGFQNVSIPLLPTSLSLTATTIQPVTCGTSGTVVITWNSVGGPYLLTIDGAVTPVTGTSQTLIIGAGTHSIQIASGNPLCVSDSRVVIINPVPAPTVAGWSIQQQPTCAGQTGTIIFAGGQSSTTQYTLSYLNGGLIGTTAGNSNRSYSVGAGIYEITRIEPNGCISSQILEIIAPATISYNVQPTDGTCGTPGSLVVTNITGGTQGYTISYSGPASGSTTQGASVIGLPAGIYTVTVTDSKGCSASTTVTIAVAPGPNVVATISSSTACVGGSFVITANVTPIGSYTYTWSGPNGFAASGNVVTVNSASVANNGSYTVVVTSAGGCSTTQVTTSAITVSVCQPPCAIGLNIVSTTSHCNQSDGQATVSASGGSGTYTYKWNTGATTPTITGLVSGVYSVTVTDAVNSSCFSSTLVAVGNEGGPQLSITSITPATCAGATGSASVAVTGGNGVITITWSNGFSGFVLNGGQIGTGVIAGVYSVTVVDQLGCSDVALVTVPSTPGTLTATVGGTSAACNQATGTATVTPAGGSGTYSYRWSNGAVTSSISGLTAGVYSVTVTDSNQCFVTGSVSIDDATGPQFTINKTNIICSGGSNGTASVNVTNAIGQVSYLWSTGAVTNSITGLSAGVYSVVVTDGNGCKASDQVTILQPSPILAELSPSTIACGTATGTITLKSINGGAPNYSYLWSNGAITPSLTGVAAGSYTLTITDANNCKATGTATLSVPTNCTVCQKPSLTVSGPVCNTATGTYTVHYLVSVGSSVTMSSGSLDPVAQTITVSLGQSLTVTARNSCGVETPMTVVAPVCSTACTANAGLSAGQAVCVNGTSYVASVTAASGATLTANGVAVTNGVITGVVGTNVTVVATLGCNTQTVVISSPASCTGNPCENPAVSVSGPVCAGTTYSVKYTAPAGVTVVTTAGVGVHNAVTQTITGIPLGTPVSVTALRGGCAPQVLNVPAPTNCTVCPKPTLTVSGPVCNTATGTYTVHYLVSVGSSVTMSSGSLDPVAQTITVSLGQSLTVTARNSCGVETPMTVVAPVCSTACTANAGLSAGQAVCVNGTSYVASVTAASGATLTANGVAVTNGVITGVVGTNVTVVATLGCNTQTVVISSPLSCTGNPCENPAVSVSGPVCAGTTYSVKYTAPAGVTVVTTAGVGVHNAVTQTITGIPLGTPVSVTALRGGCAPQVLNVLAPTNCTPCVKPSLTVSGPVCNTATGTYTVHYLVSVGSSVTMSSGSLDPVAQTITVSLGQSLTVTARNSCGVETPMTVVSPVCSTACTANAGLSAGQAVCVNGTSYVASVTAASGATLTANGVAVTNGVITGVVGTNVTVVATLGCNTQTVVISSPASCTGAPCENPAVSVSGPVCAGTTYSVKYTAPAGVTVVTTAGVGVHNAVTQTITGIPLGTPVSVTALRGGCAPQVLNVLAPTNCQTICVKPVLTAGVYSCSGSTYFVQVFTSLGATITANYDLSSIPIGSPVSITASTGSGCESYLTVQSPLSCTAISCFRPKLFVGQPICNGNGTYSVSYTVESISSVTATAGNVNAAKHTIENILIGESVNVSAGTGDCITTITVPSPTDCTDPCKNPAISLSGPICDPVSGGYINFTLPAGVSIAVSPDDTEVQVDMTNGRITGLTDIVVRLTISRPGCLDQSLDIHGGACTPCLIFGAAGQVTNVQCKGAQTGGIALTPLAGSEPVQYRWSNGAITKDLTNVSAGVYSVVIRDAKGCTKTESFTITEPAAVLDAQLSASSIACGSSVGNITLSSVNGGTLPYSYLWSNGAATPSLTGVGVGTYTLTVSDGNGCSVTRTATLSLPANCTVCQKPSLTVSGPVCNTATGTYTVHYLVSVGSSVTMSSGSLDPVAQTITVSLGQSLTVTARNSCGVETPMTVVSPVCSTACTANAGLSAGQAVCVNGTSYIASVTAASGATLTANGVAVSNGMVTGVVGTNVTVVATLGCNTQTVVISSPASCTGNPCENPAVSVSGPVCAGTTYSVKYTAPAGVTVVTTAGVGVHNAVTQTITGIPLGTPVSVTALRGGCAPQVLNVPAPTNCPVVCGKPILTVTGPECNMGQGMYSVHYISNVGATITSSEGQVNTFLQTVFVPFGKNVVITSTNNCGEQTSLTVIAPVCSTTCTSNAGLSAGQAVCVNGTSYIASVTATAGAVITANGVVVSNGVVTGVVGTNLTVVATTSCNSQTVLITSPESCTVNPCVNPLLSVAGTNCEYNTNTYGVKYTAPAGVTVTSSSGQVNNQTQTITGITKNTPLSLTVTNGSCTQFITVNAPINCYNCQKPVLSVSNPICNTATNTYSVSYIVSDNSKVTSNAGTVNEVMKTITGITQGQSLVITASLYGCDEQTSSTVVAPNCSLPPCASTPGLTVGQPVCSNGSSYLVSVTTTNPGASLTVVGGSLTNGVVTASVGSSVTVTASVPGCAPQTIVVASPNCSAEVCENPLVSVGGAICNGTTYSVKYTIPTGVVIQVSDGVLNTTIQTVTGIPAGMPLSITATYGSCTQVIGISSPVNCTVCSSTDGTITVAPVGNWIYNWIATVPLAIPPRTVNCGDFLSYVLTDAAGVILKISTTPTFTGLAAGTYYVYPTTYPAQIGRNVSVLPSIQDHACSWIASAPTIAVVCPPVCPAPAPVLTVTGPVCNTATGTYSVGYIVSAGATVTATSGNVSEATHQIVGISQGQNVVITASNICGEQTSATVTAPNCSTPCTAVAGLSAGQAVCVNGTSYVASVTAAAGAALTANGVPITNGVITGMVGTNVTVVAMLGCNTQTVVISSPASCTGDPCENPLISLGGTNCEVATYSVKYLAPNGVTVTSGSGQVNSATQTITGITLGVPVSITVSNGSCTQVISVPAPTNCNEPPLVPGLPVVTEPGKPVTVCLPITDPNVGDIHSVRLCAQPTHGTVSLPMTVNNTTHTVCFTYTPNPGYTGLDQVCLITCDQGGLCDTTYVPITIVPISPTVVQPQPPVVPVTPIVTITGVPKTECYSILDPNVGDTHSYTICGQPAHGTATVTIAIATRQICVTYTPNPGYSGPDEMCLHVCDQTGLCTEVTIPIVVIPIPGPPDKLQPPTVVPPVIVTPVGEPQTVCVQINDPNFGDTHTATICGQPSAGTVTVGAVNNQTHMVCVTYTPPPGYTGQPLGGCLQVCDQTGRCTQVPITITVIPGPTPNCPTISIISTNPTTCTANNGSVTLIGLTAGQSYTVCYSKNGNAPLCQTLSANQNGRIVILGLGVGIYTGITAGQTGCTSNAVSTTLSGGLPAPSATCSVTAVCQGQSITLTASGTNIQWSGPGLQTTTGSPVTAIPNVTGIITYMATQSANGCVSPPATVTVVVKPTPTFSVSATNPTVCNSTDGSITLTGLTPGQSYTVCYTKDGGLPVCAERLANVNGLLTITGSSAGSYTNITVNELGCLSVPKAVVLTNPALPNPTITVAPSTTICLGQPLSLTATGQPGATYTWKGLGLLGTTGSVVTVNPQSTGTLSYTVTQSVAGCGSSWTVVAITVNPVPSATLIGKTDPAACANPNGSITLGGLLSNQTYTVCYRVNSVGLPVCLQLASNNVGTIVMNGLTAGVYSVTVSNGGCSSQPVSATLIGQTPAQPTVSVSPSTTICIGQSVTLTASSNLEGPFTWTGLDLSSITGGVATALPTATGVRNYTVTQTVNGCTSIPAIIPITVMAIPAPTVVATAAPIACSGTNGSITLGGLTANQSYTVCYSNGSSTAQCTSFVAAVTGQLVVTGLTSGAYSLTVYSAGGCRNAVPVSASVASSTACSQCTDAPLIIAQPLLICKDSTKTVSMQILDADLSDSFSATVCGVGTSNATVTVGVDNQTRQLFITYKGAAGFQGIDQVCVTVTDKCGNFDQVYVPIQVIRCVCGCTGTPPVVIPQPIITTINKPKEICVPIVDTQTDSHTATICGGPQNGTAVVTVNNQTHMLCVLYTPNANYVGTDKVCITICDQTNRCTVIEVPITVVDIPNPPALSVVPVVTNCSSTTSAYMPILDINADNTHSITIVAQPLNGTITATVDQLTHRILITYTPVPGFTGNDKAVIRVTDSDQLSSPDTDVPLFVTPGTCPTCLTMELKVLLEGPYNMTIHKMNKVLNQRGLLPGQTPIGQFGVPTPAGQPYNTAPWNYTGTESVTSYAQDIVDWVLVSLRTNELSTTPVFRVAGLLHDDGRITFVNPCFSIPDGAYHVVVEHRNHMGVMSPTKVSIINNKLLFDFTVQDSYTIADPPSFGEIAVDGKWMMYGAEGKKDIFSDNFDINFFDSKLWKDESGIFDQYRYGDFNMDADVNFIDSVLWKKNNGRYSKVPH